MRSLKWMLFAGVPGLVLAWFLLTTEKKVEDPVYPVHRTIKYSFTVRNPGNRLIDKAEFWTFAPIQQTGFQKVYRVQATVPFRVEAGADGTQRLFFTLENIPPYGSRNVSITVELGHRGRHGLISEENLDQYLVEERFIESKDPRIMEIAEQHRARTESETVENLYTWVSEYLQEEGYVSRDQGALHALETKVGDCTESAYLFSALSRANHIPARVMAGYVSPGNTVLRPRDYHNWAEVYIDNAWWVVDPNKKIFREKQADYIAMNIVSGADKVNRESQRFYGTSDNIELSMN